MIELRKSTPQAVRYACLNFHYAKSVPQPIYCYNVYQDGEWCGVIVFGYGANASYHKQFGVLRGEVVELERVALNGKQKTTSECVAKALKQLHKDAPQIKIVLSFADSDQGHLGIIYQATNWIYLGMVNAGERGAFIVHGKKIHPRSCGSRGWIQSLKWLRENIDPYACEFITKGKQKYIFAFDKRDRKKWQEKAKPYPKREKQEMEVSEYGE